MSGISWMCIHCKHNTCDTVPEGFPKYLSSCNSQCRRDYYAADGN